jgi:hypothetical protein
MAESEVTIRAAGGISIRFTSQRAWADWDRFLATNLSVRRALADTLNQSVIDDIDRDFIRMANVPADGQPNRNEDIFSLEAVPPITREQLVDGMQRLRDHPAGINEPSMLINRQLIDEIRQWGNHGSPVPDEVTVGVDMGHTELFNVSMVTTPADQSAYLNPDLGEEFPDEEFTELTPVESMQTTVRMWFDDLCVRGQMPWVAEAAAVETAIETVREFTRRRMREDGFYRQILPPLQIANDELDREPVPPQVFIEDSSDPRGFRIAGYHGTQPLSAAVVFIIKTAAFAVRVERLAKSLTEMIRWPTPSIGLRASGSVVQDAHGVPNTLSSEQVDSEAP